MYTAHNSTKVFQNKMIHTNISRGFHLNLQSTRCKIVFALVISYVTSYSANIFDIYFSFDLYSYNKFLVMCLAGVVIINKYLNREIQLKAPGFLWFNIFLGYALLHGFYPGGERSLNIALALVKIYILFLITINLFTTKKDYTILGVTYLAVTSAAMAVYYTHAKQHGWDSRIVSEKLGFFVNANTMSYISTLAFITYMFATRNIRFKGRLFSQLCILAGATIIINANGSLGAILLLTIAVIFTMLNLKNIRASLLSVCIILSIGYTYYKYFPYTKQISKRIESKIELGIHDDRFYLTQISLDAFWDEPIWGKGYDCLWTYKGETINHLWYLNVLVAYGILGLLFVCIWFTRIFPARTFFISQYSKLLVAYLLIFLLLGPPATYLALAMAFLYQEVHSRAVIGAQSKSTMKQNGISVLPRRTYRSAKGSFATISK